MKNKTLAELLEIDSQLVGGKATPGLRFAERLWEQSDAVDEQQVADFLEEVLRKCTGLLLPYPAILLKRKKQIERGEFRVTPVRELPRLTR